MFFGKYRNHKTNFKGNNVRHCPRKIKILHPIFNTLVFNALTKPTSKVEKIYYS